MEARDARLATDATEQFVKAIGAEPLALVSGKQRGFRLARPTSQISVQLRGWSTTPSFPATSEAAAIARGSTAADPVIKAEFVWTNIRRTNCNRSGC